MGPKIDRHVLPAGVLLLYLATAASANLITYVVPSANRNSGERLMVMEDDGTNPVELFGGGKNAPVFEKPTVSPAGQPETWILFNDQYDLYKILPDGTDQTLVLCGAGTDKDGDPYFTGFDAQWSPDGTEILLAATEDSNGPLGSFFALIPTNHSTDQTCTSDLVSMYELPSPWTVDGGFSWNHDGSQIVFHETNMDTEEQDLAVIQRDAEGAWQRIDTIELIPGSTDLPNNQPYNISWRPQAESRDVIFSLRGYPERKVKFWLAAVDLDTGIWDFVRDKGSPVQMGSPAAGRESYPRWSSNGGEILFTDPEGDLVRWGYPDGDHHVIGSGIRADWQRDPLQLDCNITGCDDGNPCTQDSCVASSCDHELLADGSTPLGCDGECWGGTCVVAECAYDTDCAHGGDSCTVSVCIDAGLPWAYCESTSKNCGPEDGCCPTGCDFLNDGDKDCPSCLSKGTFCSSNTECCSGSCHPRKGTCK